MAIKKRKSGLFWVLLAVLIAGAGFGLWLFLSLNSLKGSAEFASPVVHYAFILKDQQKAYFVRVDLGKRMIYVIELPQYAFNPLNNRMLDVQNPLEVFSFAESMIEFSSSFRYYAVVDSEQIKRFAKILLGNGAESFENLLRSLAVRKAGLFDHVLVRKWLKEFSNENTMTAAALYKIMYESTRNALRFYTVKGTLEGPLTITVDGKRYQRLYLDAESIEAIRQDMRR
ncbi:MAG: Uncharacterized protein XD58_0122 [Thermotoga sp. 50_1627]|uniref:hypothetical protein n=1 Tax=Pseudothermotoga sp. TaxID=2033661 RepID=UPI00076DF2B0|nr:MAG: Uncharacterized protein XD45_0111 [Thermotoga sp. 50_64]KUK25961.1 MAG: Uncharacterized protein XD58_0122 [Thermotoga sp. 50_1627]MBC7116056.1 hypothetical protein [Pseudothermotoga sp.]MDK2922650.1 hypothetical protein [Pseudothermotoga sp.]HBT38624.1 hypothetical protein [Pseudothermotoga sp.]